MITIRSDAKQGVHNETGRQLPLRVRAVYVGEPAPLPLQPLLLLDLPQAAAPEAAAELLSPEGFDADRIVALIDAADLPDARKDRLRRAIRNAANTPALMDQALARVRLALGM